MKTIDQALKKLQKVGCRRKVPMPSVDELSLKLIENSLGITFPNSYKTFLKSALEFGLHFEEFLWPGTERDLIATNKEEHAGELPDFLVSFLSDGYGTQICFNMSKVTQDGEFQIVE